MAWENPSAKIFFSVSMDKPFHQKPVFFAWGKFRWLLLSSWELLVSRDKWSSQKGMILSASTFVSFPQRYLEGLKARVCLCIMQDVNAKLKVNASKGVSIANAVPFRIWQTYLPRLIFVRRRWTMRMKLSLSSRGFSFVGEIPALLYFDNELFSRTPSVIFVERKRSSFPIETSIRWEKLANARTPKVLEFLFQRPAILSHSFPLSLRNKKRRLSIGKAAAFVGKGVIALSAEAIKTQIGVSFSDFRKFNAFSRKCALHSRSFVEGKKRKKAKTRARKVKGVFLSPDLRDHLLRILKSLSGKPRVAKISAKRGADNPSDVEEIFIGGSHQTSQEDSVQNLCRKVPS